MTNQALEYVLKNRRSSRDFTIKAISKGEVQQLAWAAQGITGDDSKRTAPSAKGAYPLEVRISTGPMDDLQPAVWRYDPMSDSLVMVGEKDVRKALSDAAIGDQDWIATSPCIMTLLAQCPKPLKTSRQRGSAAKDIHILKQDVLHKTQCFRQPPWVLAQSLLPVLMTMRHHLYSRQTAA